MEFVEGNNDIERQATQWLVRLDAGPSPESMARHEEWLARSPRHKVAYTRLALAWKRMDALRRMRPLDPGRANPDLLRPRRWWWELRSVMADCSMAVRRETSRERREEAEGDGLLSNSTVSKRSRGFLASPAIWVPRLLAGAVLAGVVVAGTALFLQRDAGATYRTQVGGQVHQVLADGTAVDLNTNTKIRVKFTATRRQIFLDRGEVMLDVAHDASRPLEVVAGNVTSRAVGTKFSVRLHEDERVETLVTEGRVLVLRETSVLGIPVSSRPISHTLVAGERVVVDRRSAAVSRVTAKEMGRKLMWTTGTITFQGEAVGDVVREVNRYTKRPLVIHDPSIVHTTIGGGFDTENADTYAGDLARFFGPEALSPVRGAQPAAKR